MPGFREILQFIGIPFHDRYVVRIGVQPAQISDSLFEIYLSAGKRLQEFIFASDYETALTGLLVYDGLGRQNYQAASLFILSQ